MSELPIRELGFSTVDDYIRSIPHIALITTNKDGIIVAQGIATKETSRVARLVSGQKKPKRKGTSRFGKLRGGLLGARGLQVSRQSQRGGFRQSAPRGKTSFFGAAPAG